MTIEPLILPLPEKDTDHGRLELRWCHRHDRYAHELVVWTPETEHRLITTIEGDETMSWPPSPPVQELHVDTIDDRVTHFGVGRAGTGHWSVSVQAGNAPRTQGPPNHALTFQWACRVRKPPDQLGILYQLGGHPAQSSAIRFGPITVGKSIWTVFVDVCEQTSARVEANQLSISPVDFDRINATIQWEYRVGWERG